MPLFEVCIYGLKTQYCLFLLYLLADIMAMNCGPRVVLLLVVDIAITMLALRMVV